MSPFERIGCGDGHISPWQIGTPVFSQRNHLFLSGKIWVFGPGDLIFGGDFEHLLVRFVTAQLCESYKLRSVLGIRVFQCDVHVQFV